MISMPQDADTRQSPVVLWWGRSDLAYSRNAIIRQCFTALGWDIHDFRPWASRFGRWQAALKRSSSASGRPDLIWVPCFRQRDIAAARQYATQTKTPLCIDPLISAYDKQVDERGKIAPASAAARRLKVWESKLFAGADRVVADTHEHAEFFTQSLRVDPSRVVVIPVGADESMFRPEPLPSIDSTVRILFYGSFLALQGPQLVVEAALRLQARNVEVTMLGDGPLHAQCVSAAGTCPHVSFEPWVDYARLPARIKEAHLLLGVFGTTPKASRVIPNKVYQALASGRAAVTRDSYAYPAPLRQEPQAGLHFVEAGNAAELAAVIDAFAAEPQTLIEAGSSAYRIYQQYFSHARVCDGLSELLASMDLPAHKAQ
jgi:glycosyltransferase involved in cell wall biosynthesis